MKKIFFLFLLAYNLDALACDNLVGFWRHQSNATDLNKSFFALSYFGRTAIKVNWDFGDGSTGSGKQVKHKYSKEGNYKVTAYAYDSVVACWDTIVMEYCILDVATTVKDLGNREIELKSTSVPRRFIDWVLIDTIGQVDHYYTNPATHKRKNTNYIYGSISYFDSAIGCGDVDSISFASIPSLHAFIAASSIPVHVWPSPTVDKINILLPESERETTVRLHSIAGLVMYEEKYYGIQQNPMQLTLRNIPNGIYWITLKTEHGTGSQKIIIGE